MVVVASNGRAVDFLWRSEGNLSQRSNRVYMCRKLWILVPTIMAGFVHLT